MANPVPRMTARANTQVADRVRILLIPGSTRRHSTNLAAMRTAHELERDEISTHLFTGLADLPLFNPDDDYEPLPRSVVELRRQISLADGVFFSVPEYMGTLPGSFKNLLEWTVGGQEMDGKPVSWINVAPEGRGDGAQQTLESVLGYLGARPTGPAGRRIITPRKAVDDAGRVEDTELRAEIEDAVDAFARHLRGIRSATKAER
jgi:chromate reductase, NAD(P)H dehydrogenase (quinone)